MADVIARRISGPGGNVAHILNKLMINDGKLRLYADTNSSLYDEVTLPSSSGGFNLNGVDSLSLDSLSINHTSVIQSMIDSIANDGGGTLWLGLGIFMVASLYIPPNVHIRGCGQNVTVLRKIENSTDSTAMGAMNTTTTDIVNGARAFILFPAYSYSSSISDLTLMGNNTSPDDISGHTVGQNGDTTVRNGIVIASSAANTYGDNNVSISPFEVCYDGLSQFNSTNNCSRKNITIENVSIIGFNGAGMVIGSNNEKVVLNNVEASCNYYEGIISLANRVTMTNIRVEQNNRTGLMLIGEGNTVTNLQAPLNNKVMPDISYSIAGATHTYAGVYVEGNRNTLSNINITASFGDGLLISGYYNSVTNAVLNSNGFNIQGQPLYDQLKIQDAYYSSISAIISDNKDGNDYSNYSVNAANVEHCRLDLIVNENTMFVSVNSNKINSSQIPTKDSNNNIISLID